MSEDEKQDRLLSASRSKLPKASAVIHDSYSLKHAVALLKRITTINATLSELQEEKDEKVEELALICAAHDAPGLKHGMMGFEYHGYTSRRSLSKERLLALGVEASVIDAAYVPGKEFLNTKVLHFDIE
jgi:hypothetical protein